MTIKHCITCTKNTSRWDGCSHIDCPLRPVAWSDRFESAATLPVENIGLIEERATFSERETE